MSDALRIYIDSCMLKASARSLAFYQMVLSWIWAAFLQFFPIHAWSTVTLACEPAQAASNETYISQACSFSALSSSPPPTSSAPHFLP